MVPTVVHRVARHSSVNPVRVNIVPDVELVTVPDVALMTPGESHPVEVLIDIELQILGKLEAGSVEFNVIGKVMEVRNNLVIRVRHALRRVRSDKRVRPQYVRVGARTPD